MRLFLGLLLLVSLPRMAAAQSADDDYYPYAEPESRFEEPISDSALFYGALPAAGDLYAAASAFRLPRGGDYRGAEPSAAVRATLFGIEMPYGALRPLRLLGAEERLHAPLDPASGTVAGTGGLRAFRFTEAEPLRPWQAAVSTAVEGYRFGMRAAWNRTFGHGWRLAAALEARTGRDARIEGVFTNALTPALRLARTAASGLSWEFFAAVPLVQRGLRSASTEEAFRLTGDRYYNPAWGFQAGRVRNARVLRETMPCFAASLGLPLGETALLRLSAGGEAGVRRRSALDWYDARTPLPDNYRNMPSWTGDRETDEAWRAADPRYTQIDWDELIARNRLAAGPAVYALEDRVERRTELEFRAACTVRLSDEAALDGGLYGRMRRSRFYKEMRDLLGAQYLIDVDRYLIDDDTYSNRYENDLRHPSRTIREGDRFGYDYALAESRFGGWVHARWHRGRLRAELSAELGAVRTRRRGYYEKELFPGSGSYGRSRRIDLDLHTLKGAVGCSFSPRSYLELSAAAGAAAQPAEHLFLQPLYNNRTVEDPRPERFCGLRLHFRRTGERLDLQLTARAEHRWDGLQTRRYYDDAAAAYCDLTVAGIATTTFAIKAAAVWRPAYRWTLSATAAWCDDRYAEDATVTVRTDAENATVDLRAVSHLHGCRPGGVPRLAATAAVRYYAPRGWSLSLSAGAAAGRRVDPTPLRRTDRVARQNGPAPEALAVFTAQERLADAFTLDAALRKSIRLRDSELYILLSVRNLTGCEAPLYGYESMRTQRTGTGDTALRRPQATRLLYAYPRSVMLTAGWRF